MAATCKEKSFPCDRKCEKTKHTLLTLFVFWEIYYYLWRSISWIIGWTLAQKSKKNFRDNWSERGIWLHLPTESLAVSQSTKRILCQPENFRLLTLFSCL